MEIGKLHCLCCSQPCNTRIAYIVHPMDTLSGWIEPAADKYHTSIVVITGMDWHNVLSPWPAKGVLKGSPDFKGDAHEFLNLLRKTVIPHIEKSLGISNNVERTLIGVSMSGLFALWQWMICDTFRNIASLSGSFWYDGFLGWIKEQAVPAKEGKGYFSLGIQESKSKVKAFESVETNTMEILSLLKDAGIDVEFQSVAGNHHSDPIPRLEKAFAAIF